MAKLTGMVSDKHHPITAATILLTGSRGTTLTATDTTGHFILDHVPAGDYTIQVSAVNFETIIQTVRLGSSQDINLLLTVEPAVRQLQPVIVTGTALHIPPPDNVIGPGQITMPVMIINRKTIEQMGSRRLDEVLREQTGLAVVSDLGAGNRAVGLQMQGFSSEYISILIDGQPMVGRVNGNFDLSRISIAGIERIEIIKGASSSLYGSSALGGVINIITRQSSDHAQALVKILGGTYHTAEGTVESETPFAGKKGSAFISGDYYQTGGFNVNPYLLAGSQTSPPYNSWSLQGRAKYSLSETSTLLFSGLYSGRHSVMNQDFGIQTTDDLLDEGDIKGMIALDNHLKNGTRWIARYYMTHYSSLQHVTQLPDGPVLESDNFTETDHRVEAQGSRDVLHKRVSIIGGMGAEYQGIDAQTEGAGGEMYNYFGYAQTSWKPGSRFTLSGGLRYDGNNIYRGRLDPSLSFSYALVPWFTLTGSMGQGYKTPTYAQMYQLFTNPAGGYTVVGANNFEEGIQTLKKAGEMQQGALWNIASQVQNLKAETSTSWDGGFSINPSKKLEISANGFYNNINNLIDAEQVGIKTNGAQLFSYLNVGQAYTSGMELGFHWTPGPGLTITGGYQLLYAKNRAVIDSIKNHSPTYATVRTPTGIVPSTLKDYFGLPDRSRHMANLQLFYSYHPWGLNLSVRASYRSKYGFLDTDGNGFIDPYDVFVKGYCLVNMAVQKKLLQEQLILQLSVDNISNYTDYLMPAQPGRMILVAVAWHFFKKQSQ